MEIIALIVAGISLVGNIYLIYYLVKVVAKLNFILSFCGNQVVFNKNIIEMNQEQKIINHDLYSQKPDKTFFNPTKGEA